MGQPLKKLTIKGFKSIESLVDFELGPLNVLIGANGAGKSNFVDFFRMLRAMMNQGLQDFVTARGGADGFFYLGPKHTPQIFAHLEFGDSFYEFELIPLVSGPMVLRGEKCLNYGSVRPVSSPNTAMEAGLPFIAEGEKEFKGSQAPEVSGAVSGWTVYHFHDTTLSAGLRREQPVQDYRILRHDASNIAAFLLGLRVCNKSSYDLIRDTVRQIAPFFDDFLLEVRTKGDEEKVRLEWRQKGSDFPFQAYHLSDGTLRFICLATALLQPVLPSTIVIDEPELGLHPYAIGLLASLAQSASERTQVILSTQSPALLDYFKPEDVIVVNRREGHSTFDRLNPQELKEWLAEYSLAELWQKDVLRGSDA